MIEARIERIEATRFDSPKPGEKELQHVEEERRRAQKRTRNKKIFYSYSGRLVGV